MVDKQVNQPCMHTPTTKENLKRPINMTAMFLDWEEAVVSREIPRMHRENMQTPCRPRDSITVLLTSCCMATVPLCCP